MIIALPEVLFEDIEKDTQVYQEEPEPIFKINVIQKIFGKKLDKYKDSYYSNTFKLFLDNFHKEMEVVNNFIFGETLKQEEEESFKIIDDEEEEEEEPSEDEGDKDTDEIDLEDLYEKYKKLKKLFKKIRKLWRKLKLLKRLLKRKWKSFKNLARRGWRKLKAGGKRAWRRTKRAAKRGWKRAKNFLRKAKTKFLKWYKKTFKPFIKRMKARLKKFVKKLMKKLKVVVKKAMKKLKKIFFRIVKKFGKKILKKFLKIFGKKVLKFAIRRVLQIVAGMFSATGVGAVIGVALIAAVYAWEAYDMVQDTSELASPEFEKVDGPTEKPTTQEDEEEKLETIYFKNIQLNQINNEHIKKFNETIKDKTTLALINHSSYPLQILGRLYKFYKTCDKWLNNQQTFVIDITSKYAEMLNKSLTDLVNFTDSKEDKDLKDIPKPKKDLSKVKKPKHESHKQMASIQKSLEKYHAFKIGKFKLFLFNIKLNNKISNKDYTTVSGILKNNLERSELYITEKITTKFELVKVNKYFKPLDLPRKTKLGLLGVKNELLYALYNRIVWIKENAPSAA